MIFNRFFLHDVIVAGYKTPYVKKAHVRLVSTSAYSLVHMNDKWGKLPMIGWYDLKDFEDGGFCENNTHFYNQ